MSVYVQILDNITKDKKNNMAGQLSLFDIAAEEDKDDFDIKMPDVGEYPKEMRLAFEKEVLGIYVSGHPLEEYHALLQRHATHISTAFTIDEETGMCQVTDKEIVTIGGMIAEKTIKYTKNDKIMCFLNIEDMVGNIEVIVFPDAYQKFSNLLNEDAKVFIRGRVAAEEDKDAKIICEKIESFEQKSTVTVASAGSSYRYKANPPKAPENNALPGGVWIQFATMEDFEAQQEKIYELTAQSEGSDSIVIYIREPKGIKVLPENRNVTADESLMQTLYGAFGKENVKFLTQPIEKK